MVVSGGEMDRICLWDRRQGCVMWFKVGNLEVLVGKNVVLEVKEVGNWNYAGNFFSYCATQEEYNQFYSRLIRIFYWNVLMGRFESSLCLNSEFFIFILFLIIHFGCFAKRSSYI